MHTNSLKTSWNDIPRERCSVMQARQLRHYLKSRVLPFSSHYRNLFSEAGVDVEAIRSVDDLKRIPFTSKADLIPANDGASRAREFVLVPERDVLARQPATVLSVLRRGRKQTEISFEAEFRPILMTSTTGRSADPVPFLYTRHDLGNLELTGRRMMEIGGSQADFKHANLFPYAPHLAFWQAHYAGLGFNVFCLSTGGGKVMGTEGNVALIDRIEPHVLIGMPTFIYHVLQEALESSRHWRNLRRIVLGGEKVPMGMRRKLRDLAGQLGSGKVEVLSTYGFTEAKMAWPECPAGDGGSGYHLYPDLGIVEIVDPETGAPVGEGEPGEIVFTPLDSRGSVVLRYRTGDVTDGGLTYARCPYCERRLPRLLGRISRLSEIRHLALDKVKGTLVDFNVLEHLLDDLECVDSWQIELRKINDDPLECDELIAHVVARGSRDRDEVERSIKRRFLQATEIRPNRFVFHTPRGMRDRHGVGRLLKEEKIADNRPDAKGRLPRKPGDGRPARRKEAMSTR